MAEIIKMPKFGLTMSEGNIFSWRKSEGQEVKKDEPLFEVETDKITREFESPVEGYILHIFIKEGDGIPCGEPVAIIGEKDEDISSLFDHGEIQQEKIMEENKRDSVKSEEKSNEKSDEVTCISDYILATPLAKKLANERRVQLNQKIGTGPEGIITAKDVQSQKSTTVTATPMAKKWADANGVNLNDIRKETRILLPDVIAKKLADDQSIIENKTEVRVEPQPLTRIRKVIASRMSKSWREIPHVTLNREIDVTESLSTLKIIKEIGQERGVKYTFTHLLIKIVAALLPKHPYLNAWFDEEGIIFHEKVNIGIATALPSGLLVPVIKNVVLKDLEQIRNDLSDLIHRAKDNQIESSDLQDATFTITNLGMFGVDTFTPIINQPETGSLGVGRIVERPVFIEDNLAKRSFIPFSLSFDHRALDGAQGAQFLQDLDQYLQQPIRLLVGGDLN